MQIPKFDDRKAWQAARKLIPTPRHAAFPEYKATRQARKTRTLP